MKKISLLLATAIVIMSGMMTSCKPDATVDATATTSNVSEATAPSVEETISRFLTDSIAPSYTHGDVSIPVATVIAKDSADTADIKVWGDYWVLNYNVSGDTLKDVSGGNHPGLIHLRKSGEGYEVTAFEQVEDGARFTPSAKRIFGEHYEAFITMNNDMTKREELFASSIAAFVKANNVPATMLQDHGRPAKKIFE